LSPGATVVSSFADVRPEWLAACRILFYVAAFAPLGVGLALAARSGSVRGEFGIALGAALASAVVFELLLAFAGRRPVQAGNAGLGLASVLAPVIGARLAGGHIRPLRTS
jgi:hypothetical protein